MVSLCLFAGVFYLFTASGNLVGLLANVFDSAKAYFTVSIACIYVLSLGFLLFVLVNKSRLREKQAQRTGSNELTDALFARTKELSEMYALSSREKDVLDLIAQGRDVAYAAERLFISESTVRTHVKSIYRKMNIHNRQELFELLHAN